MAAAEWIVTAGLEVRAMARELLNHFVDTGGQWTSGQAEYFISLKDENFGANGRDIKIHETARSGSVVLSPVGGDLSSYGDAEVFLTIFYKDGSSEYLSAPLTTTMEFKKVVTLRLNFLFVIGNTGCQSIRWRAMVNAHCIYER